MATTTPNFGWDIPQSTDLVKDGATAIAALGTDIDTALVDLKGGTTGQVLSKNSNTDLDFTWVAQDDSNAIQNALLTTTGDTIYASAASTPARLGLGTAGQVLTVNSGATAPEWKTPGGYTWTSAASANFPTNTNTVTISSLSGKAYLILTKAVTFGTSDRMNIRFNSDSGNNYGDVVGGITGSLLEFYATSSTNARTRSLFIPDAASAAGYKIAMPMGLINSPVSAGGFYNSSSPITSITLFSSSGNNFSGGSYEIWSVN